MRTTTERRSHERNLNIKDLDRFDDLTWEEELFGRREQNSYRGQETFNLTSHIEDYLRSHF